MDAGVLAGWLERTATASKGTGADRYAVGSYHHEPLLVGAADRDRHRIDECAVDEDTLLQAYASWWHTNVHQPADQGPRHDPISRSTSIVPGRAMDVSRLARLTTGE